MSTGSLSILFLAAVAAGLGLRPVAVVLLFVAMGLLSCEMLVS